MATKIQRNAARGKRRLDKQDPLDLETLNSGPEGKTKSKQSPLKDREKREVLLQQQRLMQQENLKKRQGATEGQHPQQQLNKEVSEGKTVDHEERREVNEGKDVPLTLEHPQTNQHPQQRPKTEAAAEKNVGEHPEHGSHQPHGQKTEVDGEEPVAQLSVHDRGSSGHNDQGHDALADSNSRTPKSRQQRCTNCCGRPQFQSWNHIRGNSKRPHPDEAEVVSSGREEDQCVLDPVNVTCERSPTVKSTENGLSGTGESRPKSECAFPNHKDDNHSERYCSCKCRHGSHSNPASCEIDDTVVPEPSGEPESSFQEPQLNSEDDNEARLRGGCGGGCGGARNSAAGCPCGSCGGAACNSNTGCDIRPPVGCCGGNQNQGLPCRCKCQSCSNPCPPCGTCGGQNCGKWNSCAGSGGGRCCFPRNTRRRNGPNCCGGQGGGGGCC